MSKILITGNGFDLFHGLPTKYGHFMAIMMTIEGVNFKEEITFEELFGKIFKIRFSSDYDLIVKKYHTNNIIFRDDRIREITNVLRENSWYKYFKNVLELETWIDFETEIENVLNDISELFKNIKLNPNKIENYRKDDAKIFRDFNSFNFVRNQDGIYVNIKKDYLDFDKRTFRDKKLLNELAVSLEDFISIFNMYLVNFVSPFYKEIKESYLINFNDIHSIYTFNYTKTLESIYQVEDSKIIYLHGKTHEKNEFQNLILGINEIPEEFKKSKTYDFAKYYQKINKNSNDKFVKVPKTITNQLDETIFYIIGHSLDESDKDYINDLFTFLDYDLNQLSKICIFYYDKKDFQNKLKNLFTIIDKKLIDRLEKDKRLYFKELNEQNIKIEFERQLYRTSSRIGVF